MEGDYMEQGRFVFVRMFLNRGDQLFLSSNPRDGGMGEEKKERDAKKN